MSSCNSYNMNIILHLYTFIYYPYKESTMRHRLYKAISRPYQIQAHLDLVWTGYGAGTEQVRSRYELC